MDKIADRKNRPEKLGGPVDAEELSRRLTAHLAEQNLKAYRRGNFKTRSPSARNYGNQNKRDYNSTDATSLMESTTTGPTSTSSTCVSSRTTKKFSRPLFEYQSYGKKKRTEAKTHVGYETNRDRHAPNSDTQICQNQAHWKEHSSVEQYEENLKKKLYQPMRRIFQLQTVLRRKPVYTSTSEQMSSCSRETTSNWRYSNEAHKRPDKSKIICLGKEQEARNIKSHLFRPSKKRDSGTVSLSKRESRSTSSNEASPKITNTSPSYGSRKNFRGSVLAIFRRNINSYQNVGP